MKEWLRRIGYVFSVGQFHRELDEEIEFHIETRADELERSGVSRTDALARARREFGHVTRSREEVRSAWQIRWLEDLIGDLQYAGRALLHSPGFALTAIVSLALGIGVNTAIFSLTNEFLFSSPSCSKPETLSAVRLGGNSHLPMAEFRIVRDLKLFPGIAGVRYEDETNWRDGETTTRLWAARVTGNFFEMAAVPVAMGRPPQPGEDSVTVVSDHFWRNRLGRDPQVIGRSLVLDGRPHTVIGVLPGDHRSLMGFGFSPDLYMPAIEVQTQVALYIRLADGMTRQEVLDRLKSAGRELDRVRPNPNIRWSENIRSKGVDGLERLRAASIEPIAAFFVLLMTVVGMVLLIACANVASLLLARASSRRQELALRLAIGASRGRIVRQLLTESLLLATVGALAGLALDLFLTSLINAIQLPIPIPMRLQIRPDSRLLIYSVLVALGSALIAGLGPALKATRVDLNPALKLQAGRQRWNMRNVLVAGQLAVSILLLGVGTLFVRNLLSSTSLDPGFDVDHTLWAHIRLVPSRYPVSEKIHAFANSELDLARAIPGVESAAFATVVPFNNSSASNEQFRIDDGAEQRGLRYQLNRVGPEYFRTMRIPIVAGAEFRASGRESVIIVNQSFARRAFGAGNLVGRSIHFGNRAPVTVVGVAKDSKYFTLGEENVPAVYEFYGRGSPIRLDLHILIRAEHATAELAQTLPKALGELDPTAAIEVTPMRNALGLALFPSQVGAILLGSMGALGLALAAVGLYGSLYYAVSRRIGEIGVRMALGARPAHVLLMVLRQSGTLVGAGFSVGAATTVFAAKPLAQFLVPGIRPTDPASYLAVTGTIFVVAVAATIAPAIQALRVDALTALRYE